MSHPNDPNSSPVGNDPLLSSRPPTQPLPPPVASPATAQLPRVAPTARTARPTKRVKPARGTKMAAAAMSLVTTAGLAGLFANTDSPSDSVILTAGTAPDVPLVVTNPATVATAPTIVADTAPATTATTPATTAPAETTPATTVPATTVPAVAAGIADGTYVGGAAQNKWGVVQVQVVYSAGQITDVQILQYPDSENKSVRINQRSLPTLISEAIAAQSANVDGVSGATYTSNSYVASLQSAIDAARSVSGVTG